MDKAAERYLKRLRRALVCSREDRERLLKEAGDMLESFAQETTRAFYQDYVASFGPPEDFAAEMLSSLDPENIAEARIRRKRVLMGTVFAVLALLVLAAGFWFGRQSQPPIDPTPSPAVTSEQSSPTPEPTPEESEPPAPTAEPTPSPTAAAVSEPPPQESGFLPGEITAEEYLAQIYADGGEIAHKEAAAVLTKLGLVSGSDEGEFRPKNTVTKAEAARLIALIMCGGREVNVGVKETPSFSDIQGYWAEAYIEYCFDLGIAFGGEDGSFGPGDTVNGLELVRMALCMLGYDADAYRLRGEDWAIRTDELARTMDPSLYDGLEGVVMASPVTRDDTVQILYNALLATPKRVVPNYNTTEGTVTWQYVEAIRADGTSATLYWERFGLESLDDIFFD